MRLSLAPIQGVTVSVYRRTFHALFGGIDGYYAPFISPTRKEEIHPTFFDDVLPNDKQLQYHLTPQLLGNNGPHFKVYANHLTEMGYESINWNIGCPFGTITRKKKGAGILPYPDLIASFLDEVCQDLNYKLSIKMRLGMTHVNEGLKVIELLNQYPIKEVILHARTSEQQYSGTVDLEGFERLYEISKIPLAYNGDIYTVEDYLNIRNRFPKVDHIMLGRGALIDPFLASEIKGKQITAIEKSPLVQQFHEEIFKYYLSHTNEEFQLLNKMKEFWRYMHVHLDSDGTWVEAIRKCSSLQIYLALVASRFNHQSTWLT